MHSNRVDRLYCIPLARGRAASLTLGRVGRSIQPLRRRLATATVPSTIKMSMAVFAAGSNT